MKSLDKYEFENLRKNGVSSHEYVKEWKLICNECGKKWFYLDKIEKDIAKETTANSLMVLSSCGGGATGAHLNSKSQDLQNKLNELKSCPNCKSSNVSKEEKYYKK